jgi:transposase
MIKVTREVKEKIHRMTSEGKTQAEIAKDVGVSIATIRYHLAKSRSIKTDPKKISTVSDNRDKEIITSLRQQNKILWELVNSLKH